MPYKVKLGESVKSELGTYIIEEILSNETFTTVCRGFSECLQAKVLISRFHSPTKLINWYDDYIIHQKAIKDILHSKDPNGIFTHQPLDFFEGSEGNARNTYHQVFRFLHDALDMGQFFARASEGSPNVVYCSGLALGRSFMAAVAAMHELKLIHSNLTPANVLFVPDTAHSKVRNAVIVGLEWAIFSDRPAPWHGKTDAGYVGTPGYMSPEHLTGAVPVEASDTFTCALMLSELLTGEHPFVGKMSDAATLKNAVLSADFKPFKLPGSDGASRSDSRLEALINRSLSTDPTNRPTAVALRDALTDCISTNS